MGKVRVVLKRAFFLPPALMAMVALPSFAAVIYVFVADMEDTAFSYFAYVASAYAMVVTVTGLPDALQKIRDRIHGHPLLEKAVKIPFMEHIFGDILFRTRLFLYQGLFVNLLYAFINLVSGVLYHSWWFGSLAAYYILLSVMRFALLRYMNRNAAGSRQEAELRRCRFCGVLLLFMNQTLAGIVILAVDQNRAFEYPGMLIYIMAMYSFYAVIVAIVSLVKFRKMGSPVLSAAKATSLTAALVSVLSLETAMLTRFGSGEDPAFRQIMTAATGGSVCVIVLVMALFMIIWSTKQMKKLYD